MLTMLVRLLKIPERSVLAVMASVFALIGLGHAQTCMLDWSNTQSCLNLSQLSGDTILLPANVTRLNSGGLNLCPLKTSNTKVPAVIFVVDQSASMDSAFANAGTPAGDPKHWRATLVQNAIHYLADVAGSGWFSYVEFADGVESSLVPGDKDCNPTLNDTAQVLHAFDFMPLSLSNVSIYSDPKGPIQNRCQSGTDYFAALDKAKRIAAGFDPGDAVADVSIIMVSDGRPTRNVPKTYLPLDTNYVVPGMFPPVHGIFLGSDSTSDGDVLAKLADSTHGTYDLVDAGDTLAMSAVMNNIIQLISRFSAPTTVTLKVNGVNYVATQVAVAGGTYQVEFPQNIPLVMGFNPMELTVGFTDSTGARRSKVSVFTLNVAGPSGAIGIVPIDSVFSANCSQGNALVVNGLGDPQVPAGAHNLADLSYLLSDSLTSLDLRLNTIGYSGSDANLQVTSKRTGDVIAFKLTTATAATSFQGILPLQILNGDKLGRASRADSSDAILQVMAFDTLLFRWENPEDPRDTIVGSLLLYRMPTARFGADSLFIDQIITQVEDVAAQSGKVTVEYQWLNRESVSLQSLLRKDSSAQFNAIHNLKSVLLDRKSEQLVLLYTDPIFGETYMDTASLIFLVPELPVAWMLDQDGDGRADHLRLTYLNTLPASQHLVDFTLVWGAIDQDTMFFRVDSLTPKLSYDVVQITKTSAGEEWVFPLQEPFPFGHTMGSGELGAGSLLIRGGFDGRSIERSLPVTDKVGPVLLELWVDAKEPTLSYFRVSEPLGKEASLDWILDQRGVVKERECVAIENLWNESSGAYTLSLEDNDNNRIYGGDKVRLVIAENGGLRDLNGNGAHQENPFVIARGKRGANIDVVALFDEALMHDPGTSQLPPLVDPKDGEFRVLIQNPQAGDYLDLASGQMFDRKVTRGMPTLSLVLSLPALNGLDSNGNALEGMIVDGKLAYATSIHIEAHFFDQLGQFITRKTADISLEDTNQIGVDGNVRISLVWEISGDKGLRTHSGRSVGNGVILTKVHMKMQSVAQMDLNIYNVDGSISTQSVKQGDVIKKTQDMVTRLGYLRR